MKSLKLSMNKWYILFQIWIKIEGVVFYSTTNYSNFKWINWFQKLILENNNNWIFNVPNDNLVGKYKKTSFKLLKMLKMHFVQIKFD